MFYSVVFLMSDTAFQQCHQVTTAAALVAILTTDLLLSWQSSLSYTHANIPAQSHQRLPSTLHLAVSYSVILSRPTTDGISVTGKSL